MSATHSSPSVVGFVAEAPVRSDFGARCGGATAGSSQNNAELADAQENKLRQRAHRQALFLMVVSSVLSIAAAYGAWTLLHQMI